MKRTGFVTAIALGLVLSLATPDAQSTANDGGQTPAVPADQSRGQLARFAGTPIDVDYQGANLRTVLRNLSDIGGVNLVIDPSVPLNAPVDLKLTQVPWDQVLDVVLKTSQLTYMVDGPVVRVLTRDARNKELEDDARLRKASQQAPDLVKTSVRLNYASALSIKKLLEDARIISERGSVEVEERMNMLVIQDLPSQLEEIKKLVNELDRAEPQVEIEAKIIQANRDTARALGVQWGVNGRAVPELGNTTNLGFPNSVQLGGRVQSQGDVVQGPKGTNTGVNLPVVGATSALGLTLGAINGAFNLDVALSALEHKGQLKILSTPKVTTQNNKLAEMTDGFQVPIQIVANNTVTVQYKDAALKLLVTPQITAANTVIMSVQLENGSLDFSQAVNGNPAIRTQRANTQVQVADGVTTVIGGIVQTTEQELSDSTPGMSKIPLLGWLFKNNVTKNQTQELLIFITPRIIR
jgi:type IV pilus assembly protein PilQ